ncbi:hypothetical protein ABID56_002558 [Alkalibacillus flavidus]|uniref:Uncharacterized protein n=1 Tax=Alkalibacillus flavidus TaxID=546021 RepID=A0ABV2KXW2_9BACI
MVKHLDELFTDLEQYRTAQEMRLYFEEKMKEINDSEELRKIVRLKQGKVKEFVEEFYPLTLFSQSKYFGLNSRGKVVLGNQGYDASIIQQDGTEKKLEITSYIDGEWEHKDAIRLNERGYGDMRFNDVKSLKERALDNLEKVLANIRNKSLKDYRGVSLLFVINTYDFFEAYNNDSQQFIDKLISEIKNFDFKAERVYLIRLKENTLSQVDSNTYVLK